LIPSPTITTFFPSPRPPGPASPCLRKEPAWTVSIGSCDAMAFPVSGLSPVNIVSSLAPSDAARPVRLWPPRGPCPYGDHPERHLLDPDQHDGRPFSFPLLYSRPLWAAQRVIEQRRIADKVDPRSPSVDSQARTAWTSVGRVARVSATVLLAASRMAPASGCSERDSRAAARRRSSSSGMSQKDRTWTTSASLGQVPVLSNKKVRIRPALRDRSRLEQTPPWPPA